MDLIIEPRTLAKSLVDGCNIRLLDVRQPEEVAIARLPSSRHIPLHLLGDRWEELEDWREDNIVVYCHHGIRSWHATQWLHKMGFHKARNLIGGINAWSVEVDPATPRY